MNVSSQTKKKTYFYFLKSFYCLEHSLCFMQRETCRSLLAMNNLVFWYAFMKEMKKNPNPYNCLRGYKYRLL